MMQSRRISRRAALKVGGRAAAGAAALPLVHIRTAGAAGKLAIAFWDHWVPNGNAVMQKQVDAWAATSKVEVQADFITSVGNKLLMTAAAEAQAKTGHDICTFYNWDVYNHAELAGSGRRHRCEPDRQIRRDQRDRGISRQAERSLDRAADQLGQPAQTALRAHQLVQEAWP